MLIWNFRCSLCDAINVEVEFTFYQTTVSKVKNELKLNDAAFLDA